MAAMLKTSADNLARTVSGLDDEEAAAPSVGLGYTPAHWTARFTREQLVRTVEDWNLRDDAPALVLRATDAPVEHGVGSGDRQVVVGPQAALLAWLVGRSDGTGLALEAGGASGDTLGGALPELPPWR